MKFTRFLLLLFLVLPSSGFAAEPTLPEGKDLRLGGEFSGTQDSFTFGIIADRFGANPLIGWPYFEQAVREIDFLHPDFVIMLGDLIDGYISTEDPQRVGEDFNSQFDKLARFAEKLEMPLYFVAGNHDISRESMKAPFDGKPMSYIGPPFDPRRALPAMFEDHGPENAPWDRDAVFVGDVHWREIASDERGRVDFGKEYGYLICPVGYGVAFVTSPDDRMTYVRFAANDYGRLFVNGESVGKDIFFAEDGTVTFPVSCILTIPARRT